MVSQELDKGVVIEEEPWPVSDEEEETIKYRETFNLHLNVDTKKPPNNHS